MAIESKVDICNLALSHLGNYGTILDIDTPSNDKEIICSLWYDITRQSLLKLAIPNFAIDRRIVSRDDNATPPFGYKYAFEYPVDCLKALGLGDVDEVGHFIYSVNNNKIYTEDAWADGLELRFIRDVVDVSAMSPEFKLLLSWELAGNIAFPVTQDINKKQMLAKMRPSKISEVSGMNAQENKPIRISNSRFRQARVSEPARNPTKR